ncbi:MAG: DUF3575 domain-containing protein [Bacteroidetes bacterium]|nr:DUF3575 domain-containing protein [Bacteroidota bacterium]
MKKTVYSFLLVSILALPALAQEPTPAMATDSTTVPAPPAVVMNTEKPKSIHPNVIKLNLFGLGATSFNFQYERALHKNISVALGVGFLPSRGLPSILTDNDSSGTLSQMKLSGFSITPEFRFYPGKKQEKQAPKGFYIAPYLRYSKYSMSTSFLFEDSTGSGISKIPVDMKISFSGIGGGLMFGCQWLIKERVSIDWWIIGFHGGASNITGEVSSYVIAQDPDEFKEQLDEIEIPFGSATSSVSGDKASLKITTPFAGIRGGLCIGFAF